MPTAFLHRLILICPQGSIASVGAWYAANIDAADNGTTWPALNPSGDPAQPVTHRWTSTALTEPLLRAVIVKVCQLAAVTPPTAGTWNGWTRAQKQSWLVSTRNQLFTNTGIWLDLADNDGVWNDPGASLTTVGVKVRQAAVP